MDRPGVRQVPEGGGEQGKMEKTGCEIICGAPTTLAVKGLMMMMMMLKTTATVPETLLPTCIAVWLVVRVCSRPWPVHEQEPGAGCGVRQRAQGRFHVAPCEVTASRLSVICSPGVALTACVIKAKVHQRETEGPIWQRCLLS